MVFTKDRHPHKWTITEKKKLLELFKSEPDWNERSKKMYECFPNRRTKGFFSPTTCHAEFDKIIHSPPPVNPTGPPSTAGFSIRTVVDMWIEHLQKEITKEDEQQMELCMVDIRSSYALVERLLTGKPEMSDDQMLALLEEARAYDAKRDPSTDIVVNAYMRRLMAQEEAKRQTGQPSISPSSIPPTKNSDILPRGSETAFRSPSPSRSPIKTPIRRVAEAVREGISPVKTESPQRPAVEAPTESISSDAASTPTKTLDTTTETVEETMKEVEPPKEDAVEQPPPESVDQSPRKENKEEQRAEVEIEKPNKPGKRGRKRAESPAPTPPIKEEKSEISPQVLPQKSTRIRRSEASNSRVKKIKSEAVEQTASESRATSTPTDTTPPSPGRAVAIDTQTDISVVSSYLKAAEKKERRLSASKKTRGRIENTQDPDSDLTLSISDDGERRAVALQCTRLDFDRDDKIVISWIGNEKKHVPLVDISVKNESVDEGDDKGRASNTADDEDRRTKADSKKEVTVIYDVEDWLAKALLLNPAYSLEDESPAKRANLRKDDKQKEDSIQAKLLLMNTWRAVQNHRHSTIFLHPVSEKEAPGYSMTIKQRMDLNTLKKEIESGAVSTAEQMKHRLMKMFANAVMYNPTEHDINFFSKEMARDTLTELTRLMAEGQKGPQMSTHHPRRSKVAEESTSRPTRSHVPQSAKNAKVDEDRFSHVDSKSRTVFRRKRGKQQ